MQVTSAICLCACSEKSQIAQFLIKFYLGVEAIFLLHFRLLLQPFFSLTRTLNFIGICHGFISEVPAKHHKHIVNFSFFILPWILSTSSVCVDVKN